LYLNLQKKLNTAKFGKCQTFSIFAREKSQKRIDAGDLKSPLFIF